MQIIFLRYLDERKEEKLDKIKDGMWLRCVFCFNMSDI